MYSSKNKTIKYASRCGLMAALFASMFTVAFSGNASAQGAWLPDRMKCTLSGSSDIDFGVISGFEDRVLTAASNVKPTCKSDYFTQDKDNKWIVSGSACVGLKSLQSPHDVAPRYLYLNGDVNSPYKLPYDYFLNFASQGKEVGDGVTTAGGSLSYAAGVRGEAMPTGPVDVDLDFNLIARYNFHYTDLPVGKYWNRYNITMRTGAGGGNPTAMSFCEMFPDVTPPVEITVMAEIKSSCALNIKRNINFGVHTRLTSNITAYGELSIRCNSNANYEVLLDGGRNKNTNDRRMSLRLPSGVFDDTKKIAYDVYLPNTHTNWGDQKGVDTYKGIGSNSEQSIRIDAKVNPQGNFNPAVGNYHDTLVVTVFY